MIEFIRITLAVLCLGFFMISCNRSGNDKGEKLQNSITIDNPRSITVHLQGQVPAVEDSTFVYLISELNDTRQFLSSMVLNGAFDIQGELPEAGFYDLVILDNKYKVYLEKEKYYLFKSTNGREGRFDTDSETTHAYYVYQADYKKNERILKSRIAELPKLIDQNATNNDKYWQYGEELMKRRAELSDFSNRFAASYISKAEKENNDGLIPYLITVQKVNKSNYKQYKKLLTEIDKDYYYSSTYRKAAAQVNQVEDFYSNMPVFPAMTPRNPQGDSLFLDKMSDKKAILIFFYIRWSPQSKAAIQLYKNQIDHLRSKGVESVFLTWDEDFKKWEQFSAANNMGVHNYRLNYDDKNFVLQNYSVAQLPRLILIDAKTREILNEKLKEPDEHGFLEDIYQSLGE